LVCAPIVQGLCQLFELYFFSIFKTFGQREAFSGTRSSSDSYCKLTQHSIGPQLVTRERSS
jgi:hypothetical protein